MWLRRVVWLRCAVVAVVAGSLIGVGPVMAPASATTPVCGSARTAAAPGAPRTVTITANRWFKSVTITWAPPASAGSTPVTGYRVGRTGVSASSTVLSRRARSFTFTGLRTGSAYTVSVCAVTRAGTGPAAARLVIL